MSFINPVILVVDAHPVYPEKTVGFLKSLSFHKIIQVDNGVKALKVSRETKLDWVVLSSSLPDIDAVDICQKLRESNQENLKIIVQAGLLTTDSQKKSFEQNGALTVIPRLEKNFSELQAVISSHLHFSSR